MGAWGVLAFDNDDACDWAYLLEKAGDLSLIETAFKVIEDTDGYLDGPDAANALAACEVLARLNGKPGYKNAYTELVDQWVAAHPIKVSTELLTRANAMIDRILGDSELAHLWKDSNVYHSWLDSVADLRARMQT